MATVNGWRTLPSGKKIRSRRIAKVKEKTPMDTVYADYYLENKYKGELVDWFNQQPWTHFLTLTFKNAHYRDGVKPPSYTFVRDVARYYLRYRGWDQGVLILEQGKLPHGDLASEVPSEATAVGRYHLHGMARFKSRQDANFFSALWDLKYGYAKVEEIKNKDAIVNYCTKYVFKDWSQGVDKYAKMWYYGVDPWYKAGFLPPLEAPRG
jgi:hypothetical protein